MRRIVIFLGTRPEAIKLIPVFKELRKNRQWQTLLVSTGQHVEMLKSVFEFFEVFPDRDLKIMTKGQSLEQLTISILDQCTALLKELRPDLVIVQGDTTTCMAVALAAFYQKIRVAH